MSDLVPTTDTPSVGVAGRTPRLPELGRLRGGSQKTDPKRPGAPLQTWRVTSNDEYALRAIASAYGGEVSEWIDLDGKPGEQRYQLVTEAEELPVRLPPNPVSVAYERWNTGGLQRRCDGQDCIVVELSGEGKQKTSEAKRGPCWCIAKGLVPHEDARKGACVLTTRLRVVLEDAPGIGHWLLTTHSIIAAMELPAQAEFLASLGGAVAYVPASLAIDPRSHKRTDEPYKREYLIPTLRIRRSPRQLAALRAGVAAEQCQDQPAVANGHEALEQKPKAIEARASEPVQAEVVDQPAPSRQFAEGFAARCKEAGLSEEEAGEMVAKVTKGRTHNAEQVAPHERDELRKMIAAHLAAAKAEQAEAESAGRPF